MKHLKVIAFTHKHVNLKDLGHLVICNEELESRLINARDAFDIAEIFYVATCNRVEFIFHGCHDLNTDFVKDFLRAMNFCVPDDRFDQFLNQVNTYSDIEALNHLFRMSCSLESLVVGEKEILAQVRRAYEHCRVAGLTGDFMRMVMGSLVKTAKEVYTKTLISRNPVSVVSLAYRRLRDLLSIPNPRILIIGAGETNQNISKYLQKHRFSNFVVFNRTLSKARKLAKELNGVAYSLDQLQHYDGGFDILVTCTGSTDHVITPAIYKTLLNGDTGRKIVVDLAIPNDTDPAVVAQYPLHYIEVSSLQVVANKNLQERYNELVHAERIIEENIREFLPLLKQRKVEIAMRQVPEKVKEIRSFALNTVFADEVGTLDEHSRQVLEKVINYMEKKYISVPMIMAKEILVAKSKELSDN